MQRPHHKGKILLALEQSKRDKSPEIDGLPAEFYKQFSHIISDEFTEVTNYCFKNNTLSDSQKRGMITCLFKKGDRENLAN